MNDEFFKSLKDNLDNRPEPPFRKEAWKAMEHRLQEANPTQANRFKNWLLPLLLLVFTGLAASNFYLIHQLKQTQQVTTLLQIDTIYKSQVIIQRDTIFQSKVIRETIKISEKNEAIGTSTNLLFSAFNFNLPENLFKKGQKTSVLTSLFHPEGHFNFNGQNAWNHSYSPSNYDESSVINQSTNNSLKSIDNPEEELSAGSKFAYLQPFDKISNISQKAIIWDKHIPLPFFEIPFVKQKKSVQQRLYQMRPKSFYLGFKGGIARATNSKIDNLGGSVFGIDASVGFSSNFRLWADAAFLQLTYESTLIEESLGIPDIAPPGNNYDFHKAEAIQPSYQFGMGLQYLFNSQKKWKPYLGMGYGIVTLVPYEVNYEFKDPTGLELKIEKMVDRNDLLKGQLLLKAGGEYEINNRFGWKLEGTYRTQKGNTELNSLNFWGVRTGLHYKF